MRSAPPELRFGTALAAPSRASFAFLGEAQRWGQTKESGLAMLGAAPGRYLYSLAPLISPPDGLDFSLRAALVLPGRSQTPSPAELLASISLQSFHFYFFFPLPFTSETFLSQLPGSSPPCLGNETSSTKKTCGKPEKKLILTKNKIR